MYDTDIDRLHKAFAATDARLSAWKEEQVEKRLKRLEDKLAKVESTLNFREGELVVWRGLGKSICVAITGLAMALAWGSI